MATPARNEGTATATPVSARTPALPAFDATAYRSDTLTRLINEPALANSVTAQELLGVNLDVLAALEDDALDEITQRGTQILGSWQKERSPKYTSVLTVLLQRRNELTRAWGNPASVRDQARHTLAQRASDATAAQHTLTNILDGLAAAHGHIPEARLPALRSYAAELRVDNLDELLGAYPQQPRGAAEAETSAPTQALEKHHEAQLAATLRELNQLTNNKFSAQTLFAALNVDATTPTSVIAERVTKLQEGNQKRRHDRMKTLLDDLAVFARRFLVDADPLEYARSCEPLAERAIHPLLTQAALHTSELSRDELDALLGDPSITALRLPTVLLRSSALSVANTLGLRVTTPVSTEQRAEQPAAPAALGVPTDVEGASRVLQAAAQLSSDAHAQAALDALLLIPDSVLRLSTNVQRSVVAARANAARTVQAARSAWLVAGALLASGRVWGCAAVLERLAASARDVAAPAVGSADVESRAALPLDAFAAHPTHPDMAVLRYNMDLAQARAVLSRCQQSVLDALGDTPDMASLADVAGLAADCPQVIALLATNLAAPTRISAVARPDDFEADISWSSALDPVLESLATLGALDADAAQLPGIPDLRHSLHWELMRIEVDPRAQARRSIPVPTPAVTSPRTAVDRALVNGSRLTYEVALALVLSAETAAALGLAERTVSRAASTPSVLLLGDVVALEASADLGAVTLTFHAPAQANVVVTRVASADLAGSVVEHATSPFVDRGLPANIMVDYVVACSYPDDVAGDTVTDGARVSVMTPRRPSPVTRVEATSMYNDNALVARIDMGLPLDALVPSSPVLVYASEHQIVVANSRMTTEAFDQLVESRGARLVGSVAPEQFSTLPASLIDAPTGPCTYTVVTPGAGEVVVGASVRHANLRELTLVSASNDPAAVHATLIVPAGTTELDVLWRSDTYSLLHTDLDATKTRVKLDDGFAGGEYELVVNVDDTFDATFMSVWAVVRRGAQQYRTAAPLFIEAREAHRVEVDVALRPAKGLRRSPAVVITAQQATGDLLLLDVTGMERSAIDEALTSGWRPELGGVLLGGGNAAPTPKKPARLVITLAEAPHPQVLVVPANASVGARVALPREPLQV